MNSAAAVQMSPEQARDLAQRARRGDETAFKDLLGPWRLPLFRYLYRMAANWDDAEDLLQDVFVRVLRGLGTYRGESSFNTWLFGIATHVCLDHLREKRRWRAEAQLAAEEETLSSPDRLAALEILTSRPDFVYEVREHIAFCFSCMSRSLPIQEQATLVLREVMGFTNEEAAHIAGVSEPVLRHQLSSARSTLETEYEGLCQLINKTGRCDQCRTLREFTPERNRGADLIAIEVAPGIEATADSLMDARIAIVKAANLEHGRTRAMHRAFFSSIGAREERQPQ